MSFYSIRKKELADIADAIRAKTGKSDGMSVEDMPNEISDIKNNGLNQGISISGSYVANDKGTHIIEHNLGVAPDIIIVYAAHVEPQTSYGSQIISMIGFSRKLVESLHPLGDEKRCQYISAFNGVEFYLITPTNAIEENDSSLIKGTIHNATDTIFSVGGTTLKHVIGATYGWTVVGGITTN